MTFQKVHLIFTLQMQGYYASDARANNDKNIFGDSSSKNTNNLTEGNRFKNLS